MKHIIISILFLVFAIKAFAQDVAISEYKDSQGTPLGEWTELIVLRDGASVANDILRDNNGTTLSSWSGGVRFKDIPLWKNLRRGTIIVVYHRDVPGTVYDYDASDGFIEIPATDGRYFDKYLPDGTASSGTWDIGALSINESRDIIELADADGNHIHSLSHGADTTGSLWRSLPIPKPNFKGSVFDGCSIAIYGGGLVSYYVSDDFAAVELSRAPSCGLANSAGNAVLWLKLREPVWTNNKAQAAIGQFGVRISWSKSEEVRSDTDGYMIVRYNKADSAKMILPKDGHIYENGDTLGSAVVVANIGGNISYDFYDNTDLPCNTLIGYRIYAYRFRNSGASVENNPTNARGRQYQQENFAETTVEKKIPTVPEIEAKSATEFCEGDSVILSVKNPVDTLKYIWTLNGKEISGSEGIDYTAKKAGKYSVAVFDKIYFCNAFSAEIEVKITATQPVKLLAGNNEIQSDTNIFICKGDGIVLGCSSAEAKNISWLKDGKIFKENTDRIAVSEVGKYICKVKSSEICASFSHEVSVLIKESHLKIVPDTLRYIFSGSGGNIEETVNIINPDSFDIQIKTLELPSAINITEPEMPATVPASSSIQMKLTINTSLAEQTEIIKLSADCSDDTLAIVIQSVFNNGALTTNRNSIDFGEYASCEAGGKVETITLSNFGNDVIILNKPETHTPFSLTGSENFPITIEKNQIKSVSIQFDADKPGTYSDTLIIPYTINDLNYISIIPLSGKVDEVKYNFQDTVFTLTGFAPNTPTKIQFITFTNSGDGTVIVENPGIPGIKFPYLPMSVKPGETVAIEASITLADSNADTTFAFNLTVNPCGGKTSIRIDCRSRSISADKYIFDYGFIPDCSKKKEIVDSLMIYAHDTVMTVSNIAQAADFSVNIKAGDVISDSSRFYVTFKGKNPGLYSDSAKITCMPGNSLITLYFNAVIEELTTSLPDSVEFPQTSIYSESDTVLVIKNTNSYPIEIKEIIGLSAPFSIKNAMQLPYIIQPGATVNLYIGYYCSSYLDNYQSVIFNISVGECDYVRSVVLVGKAAAGDTSTAFMKLKMSVPQQAKVGSAITIPVKIAGIDAEKFASLLLKHVEFDLTYTAGTILPKTLLKRNGSVLSGLIFEKRSRGIIHCGFDPDAGDFIPDSGFFSIPAEIFLGNADSARLTISHVELTGEKKAVCFGDTAVIKIFGDCAYENGLVEIGQSSAVKVKINSGNLEIDCEIMDENGAEIQIIDAAGRNVFTRQIGTKRGSYSLLTDLPPAGVYFAVLRNGNFPRVLKFVIQ